ncbi:MAG: VWA domain-containing protein [Candidatus Sulfotelmatobacter sp.]
MIIKTRHCAVAALVCCFLIAAKSEDKTNETKPSQPKLTARTELVMVPALVTDKSGNHITGLKQEDFSVQENGAAQKIATFEEITSQPAHVSRVLNANEFSNSVAGDFQAARVTIIVLDFINTPFMAQTDARKQLLKYLAQSADAREPTGLYTLTRNGIEVIHDFTSDPAILAAALHMVNGDPYQMVDTPETSGSNAAGSSAAGSAGSTGHQASKRHSHDAAQKESQALQKMTQDTEQNFRAFEQRVAITYTLQGLQQIAQAVGGIPGRKALIWASGGFPFNVSDTMQLSPVRDSLADVLPLYERTWQLLNQAQIALYPVDVKGLRVLPITSGPISRNPRKFSQQRSRSRDFDTQSSFEIFASATGGRAYFGSNDLSKGFRDAVNDSSQYYMLGYYRDSSQSKPGWRKLNVKTDRSHVEVRARSGFYLSETNADRAKVRTNDLSSALQSPVDFTSLSLVVRWNKVEDGKKPGTKRVNYEVRLAPGAALIDDSDNNRLALDFVALPKTPDGQPAGPPMGQKIDGHLPPEKLPAIRQQGVLYTDAVELAPGDYTVRFVVRDDLSGRMGSLSAPLKVE